MNELGERIRRAREARGASLRAIAADAGISPSLLSQVETGKVRPSVSTLYAITTCLGLSVDDVLGAPSAARVPSAAATLVQRHEDEPALVMQNGVTWRRLAGRGPGSAVDAVRVTYEPRAASSLDGTHMRHAGVEYGTITAGELTLKVDFETYRLRAGDSFCFDSMRPHFYVNEGAVAAEGIWFVVGRGDGDMAGSDEPLRSAVEAMAALSRLPHEAAP
ncbi:XRE family transcriptional regulator [Microbacterium sp. NPDC096154]|uniref:helix-turn-helix domain-containing protein n=1 Tax=Microbacterium sp. NPDC096154 TaxID=3155549 RepID=UPI00332D288A